MGKFKGGLEPFRLDGKIFEKGENFVMSPELITLSYKGDAYKLTGTFAAISDEERDGRDEDRDDDDDDDDNDDGGSGADDALSVAGAITGIEVVRDGVTIFKAQGLSIDFRMFDDEARCNGSGAMRKLLMSGDDAVSGSRGNDKLEGHDGNDDLNGGRGDDVLVGGSGSDDLDGGLGDDRLSGDVGNDTIDGGVGDDGLTGGAGNDTIEGGLGADILTGGAGSDVFDFNTVADSARGKHHDIIRDYKTNDEIDLSGIDANTRAKGNQTFRFSNDDDGFSRKPGELLLIDNDLYADVNGDGRSDFHIEFSQKILLDDDNLML